MNEQNKKQEILDSCLDKFKKRLESLGQNTDNVTADSIILELFPENKENTAQENMLSGEAIKLEVMVDCELEHLDNKFRLECSVFFDDKLTIGRFSELIYEASQKTTDSDAESIESKFQKFFNEAENAQDLESELDKESADDEEDDVADDGDLAE